jgi:hypothetical protein
MSVDRSRIESAAGAIADEIDEGHEGHPAAAVRTVGVVVAVGYDDPESGERHTTTHYRFTDESDTDCPNYVAIGLLRQVENHLQ